MLTYYVDNLFLISYIISRVIIISNDLLNFRYRKIKHLINRNNQKCNYFTVFTGNVYILIRIFMRNQKTIYSLVVMY